MVLYPKHRWLAIQNFICVATFQMPTVECFEFLDFYCGPCTLKYRMMLTFVTLPTITMKASERRKMYPSPKQPSIER